MTQQPTGQLPAAQLVALLQVHAAAAGHRDGSDGDAWSSALAAALQQVLDGASAADAVRDWLAAAGSPADRVVPVGPLPPDPAICPGEADPAATRVDVTVTDGVAVVDLRLLDGLEATRHLRGEVARLRQRVAEDDVAGVVLDLRGARLHLVAEVVTWCADLVGPLTVPGLRVRVLETDGTGSWLVADDRAVQPAAGAARRRLAVVLDAQSSACALATALAGTAAVVQDGEIRPPASPRLRVAMPGAVAELEVASLAADLRLDAVVTDSDAAVPTALRLLRGERVEAPAVRSAHRSVAPGGPAVTALVALGRMHAAVTAFSPYLDLLDEPWEQGLEEAAARLAAVGSERERDLVLAEVLCRLQDGHALVGSAHVMAVLGSWRPDVRLQHLAGDWVVASAGAPGAPVGSRVLRVDGVAVEDRVAAVRPLLPVSTVQGADWRVASFLLAGPQGTSVRCVLEDLDGRQTEQAWERRVAGPVLPHPWRETVAEVGDAVYVDLGRLEPHEVLPALARAGRAERLVLDLRRYPRSTVMLVASRLATSSASGARVTRRRPTGLDGPWDPSWHPGESRMVLEQLVHPDGRGPRFTGPVAVLLDEGTISQGEHTALLLRAARPDLLFVGSPTNGTNGDMASAVLAEGVTMTYTGLGISWPDGTQLQRRGVLPDVTARPTREGLRAGTDEVLEAALAALGGRAR